MNFHMFLFESTLSFTNYLVSNQFFIHYDFFVSQDDGSISVHNVDSNPDPDHGWQTGEVKLCFLIL